MDALLDESSFNKEVMYPIPPPSPSRPTTSNQQKGLLINRALQGGYFFVGNATRDLWDGMFDESYGADVVILTEHGGKIYGHARILGMASQVLKNMLKKSNGRKQSISIRGVPHDALCPERCGAIRSSSLSPLACIYNPSLEERVWTTH
ncbi:BTB/POZ and TAZ domain-containing protein [Drosera capensis]